MTHILLWISYYIILTTSNKSEKGPGSKQARMHGGIGREEGWHTLVLEGMLEGYKARSLSISKEGQLQDDGFNACLPERFCCLSAPQCRTCPEVDFLVGWVGNSSRLAPFAKLLCASYGRGGRQ